MIEIKMNERKCYEFIIPNHKWYRWLIIETEETFNHYKSWNLYIENTTYETLNIINNEPYDDKGYFKLKELIIREFNKQIKDIEEINEILETVSDLYWSIKKIREYEPEGGEKNAMHKTNDQS